MQFGEGKIGGKYTVGPKIGSGSFGEVYLVNNFGTDEIYALKREDEKSKNLQLLSEAKIIKNLQGFPGFVNLYWQGNEYKSNMIIMDMLGPTIEDLFIMCKKKFSLKTTLMLADQFIQRIEWVHSKDYLHRDIKTQNFLMGLGKTTHIVHLIDFGLCKKYRDSKTHQHIPYKQNKNLTGTARYASINSHLGIEHSRRDDLESLGYTLIYLLQGFLPWQGVRANNKLEKYQKIMEKKMSIPVEVQCKHLPIEFSIYLNYCRSLKFEDKPNYNYLRSLFLDLLKEQDYNYDFEYDWCKIEDEKYMDGNRVKIEIRKEMNMSDVIVEEKGQFREENLLEDGEQNVDDEQILDDDEEDNFIHKREMGDLEEKKNKLLFE